jgi:hypothetical protein
MGPTRIGGAYRPVQDYPNSRRNEAPAVYDVQCQHLVAVHMIMLGGMSDRVVQGTTVLVGLTFRRSMEAHAEPAPGSERRLWTSSKSSEADRLPQCATVTARAGPCSTCRVHDLQQ